MARRCRMEAVGWAGSVRICDASDDHGPFNRSVVSVLPYHGEGAQCC